MLVLLAVVVVVLVIGAGALHFTKPSNRRQWSIGQQVMPSAQFQNHHVTIHNVRNFSYAPDATPTIRYEDRTYDLDRIETVWFVLAPFSHVSRGAAHAFLSFGFADSQYIAISVEARRELGEKYSLLGGLLRRFEILYVVGDERDLIGVRSNVNGQDVYLYPIRTTSDKARELFVQMLQRANALREKPEFYNTVTNNCTTNILRHANSISPRRIPYGREVLLPGYADALAERLGLLDTTLPIDEARKRFLVSERARAYANDPEFSSKIRALD